MNDFNIEQAEDLIKRIKHINDVPIAPDWVGEMVFTKWGYRAAIEEIKHLRNLIDNLRIDNRKMQLALKNIIDDRFIYEYDEWLNDVAYEQLCKEKLIYG